MENTLKIRPQVPDGLLTSNQGSGRPKVWTRSAKNYQAKVGYHTIPNLGSGRPKVWTRGAKNYQAKVGCHTIPNLATYNIRCLSNEE